MHGGEQPPPRTVHREMFKAYVNMLCTMAGSGILGLPYTLRQGGWLMAPLMIVIGSLALYTARLVADNLHRPDGRLPGYPETGYEAMGRPGRWLVHVFQKLTLIGVSILFLILSAGFLHDASETLHGPSLTTKQWTLISAGIVSIPVLFQANVDALASTSTMGGAVTFATVVGVLGVALSHPPEDTPTRTFVEVKNFPIAFSAVCLSFGGHGVIPTVQDNMAKVGVDNTHFKRVLDYAFGTLILFYVPVATVGYYVYGNDVASPVVNSLPASNGGTVTIQLAITVHLLMAFPIPQHVVYSEVERSLGLVPEDGSYMGSRDVALIAPRFAIRLFGVVGSTLTAYYVPYFGDCMSLVGALGDGVLVFILPCLFALILHERERPKARRTGYEILWYVWLGVIMCVGVVCAVFGAKQAISNLIDDVEGSGSSSSGT